MRDVHKERAAEAWAIIERLADKWRVELTIEEIIGHLAERRSYERVEDYHRLGLISDGVARRCVRLLDEALGTDGV